MPVSSTAYMMMAYTQWADDVVLQNAAQLSDAELMAPRDALFRSISGTFDHTLVVAEIFQAHLEGRPHGFAKRYRDAPLPFAEVARRTREMNAHMLACAAAWSDEALAEDVSFKYVDGDDGVMTREGILLHLANHATYHRGFVSTLLFPLGVKGKASDLSVFLTDVWRQGS